MDPAHDPSSTPSAQQASQLPPEAIALAGRFFEAARKGDEQSELLLRAALERGGRGIANLTNDKGDSLVMLSAYHGHASILKALLAAGGDPNSLNERGQSPLAGVVFKNERECIIALLESGADPEIGEPNAIDSCRVFRQEEYMAMFLEQVEKLKSSGSRTVNGVSQTNGVVTNGHAHTNSMVNGDT